MQRNVLGTELVPCSFDPMTGYYRTGCCESRGDDPGVHVVCAIMTDEFRSRFPVGTTMSFARYMDFALYDESVGFYATVGRAGRRGDGP